jgi:soluble lytic murein transglycosylase-like protein
LLKRLIAALVWTFKGLYDLLATYLLVYLLPFVLVAFGLHVGAEAISTHLGFVDNAAMWALLAGKVGTSTLLLRVIIFAPLHVALFGLLRRPRSWLKPRVEKAFERVIGTLKRWLMSRPRLELTGEVVYSVMVTALLVPFVIQPTLERRLFDGEAWAARGVNLLDGTASAAVVESTVGFYRLLFAEPVLARELTAEALEQFEDDMADASQARSDGTTIPVVGPAAASSSGRPMMDRWDPILADVAGGDPDRFATLKAFMWVESAGQQYAVSPTGCVGLMQFCSGTARDHPFRGVFGIGQVYSCSCDGACRVGRETRRDLESGVLEDILVHEGHFPCELTDARFDPYKSIAAADLYVERLGDAYGNNLYLMYIGYNSGPAVSDTVWLAVGRNPEADLKTIRPHLTPALEPYYGGHSASRAAELLDAHLPKLAEAKAAYDTAGPTPGAAPPTVMTPGDIPHSIPWSYDGSRRI